MSNRNLKIEGAVPCSICGEYPILQDAFELFREQSNYTQNEKETYRKMLSQDSVDIGVNIFNIEDDEN